MNDFVKKKPLNRVAVNDIIPEAATTDSSQAYKRPAVYVITTENNLQYVGSTCHVNKRASKHACSLKDNCHPIEELQEAYNNGEQLTISIAYTNNREEAFDFEQKYLDQSTDDSKVLNKAYNARASRKGIPPSEYNIKRIIETHTGKIISKEIRKKMSDVKKGMVVNEEEKKRLSEIAIRKPITAEGIEYPSLVDASKVFGITSAGIAARCRSNSNNFKNWTFK